jgi:predicted transposase YdaD
MLEEGEKRIKTRQIGAYLYAVLRANPQAFLEVSKMRNNTLRFDEVLVQLGLTAKWKEEGEKKGRMEVAQNMLAKGWSQKKVAETTGLDIKTVESLYRK